MVFYVDFVYIHVYILFKRWLKCYFYFFCVPQSGRAFALPLVAVEPPLASRPFGLQSLTHFAPTLRMAAGSRCAPLGRHPSGKCSGFDWGFGAETMATPSSPLTPGKPCYLTHPEQGKSKLVIWDAKGRCPSAHPGRERCPLHLGYRSPRGRGARRIPCPSGESVSGLIRVKVKPLRGRLRRTLTLHRGRKNILKIHRAY